MVEICTIFYNFPITPIKRGNLTGIRSAEIEMLTASCSTLSQALLWCDPNEMHPEKGSWSLPRIWPLVRRMPQWRDCLFEWIGWFWAINQCFLFTLHIFCLECIPLMILRPSWPFIFAFLAVGGLGGRQNDTCPDIGRCLKICLVFEGLGVREREKDVNQNLIGSTSSCPTNSRLVIQISRWESEFEGWSKWEAGNVAKVQEGGELGRPKSRRTGKILL